MIINEIDEKDSKNNRTIDTESGIYLTALRGDIRDNNYNFFIHDNGFGFSITTYRSRDWLNKENKITSVNYTVDMVRLGGRSVIKDYVPIIEALLKVSGAGFRSEERTFGVKEVVSVEFSPRALETLKAAYKDKRPFYRRWFS